MNDSFAKVLYYFVFSKLFGSFFIMETTSRALMQHFQFFLPAISMVTI